MLGTPPDEQVKWTTLDLYCPADIKFDLSGLAELAYNYEGLGGPYDEIHAYEVLEHFGEQGNVFHFFNTFNNLWCALKHGGILAGTSPGNSGPWVWGDPGHTRVISRECISFLEEKCYDQLGETTASDYRSLVDGHWWEILHLNESPNRFEFGLRKV